MNKRSQHIAVLFLGIMIFLFFSCKKDDPKPEPLSFGFTRKALDYVKLVEGKYLIYKDSASGLLDSVIITNSKLEKLIFHITTFGDYYYYAERFSLTLTKYINFVQQEWLNLEANVFVSAPIFTSSETADMNLYELNGFPVFYFAESSQPNYSITVEGKLYNNVVLFSSNTGVDINHPAYKNATYYWAKGIGIIKREIITTGGVIKTQTLLRNN